jgi:hypothetical protein
MRSQQFHKHLNNKFCGMLGRPRIFRGAYKYALGNK